MPPRRPPSQAVTHIGLALDHTLDFFREVLRGIRDYGHQKPDWIFVLAPPSSRSLNLRHTARCAGFIGHVSTLALARAMQATNLPWVNVSSVHPHLRGPRVMVDHEAVGRLAARYFLDRQFRAFAFVGYRDHLFSMGREAGFRSEVEAAGCRLHARFEAAGKHAEPTAPQYAGGALHRWLRSLPKPIAAFASNDVQGFQVCEACRECGIQVPEQIALMSVDNDDLLCDLAQPPLSSVALPARQLGYEAARLLDDLLGGRKVRHTRMLLPPTGIVERASSNILAINDALIARALTFIRTHAHRAIGVEDVAAGAFASRRLLERAFRRVLQRTIAEEIRRARMDMARRLLVETRLPMSEVARAAGFTDGKHFATTFRRLEGNTPTAFRGRHGH